MLSYREKYRFSSEIRCQCFVDGKPHLKWFTRLAKYGHLLLVPGFPRLGPRNETSFRGLFLKKRITFVCNFIHICGLWATEIHILRTSKNTHKLN